MFGWAIMTMGSFVVGMCAIILVYSNCLMLGHNITRIDLMKGIFKFNDKSGMSPNPYNLGIITNYAYFF